MADSFLPAPERRQLAWAIADVYDWEVDFSRDIRPGDRFTVLLERLESSEGERRFGRILAARVDVARTPQYAFYFEDPTGDDAVTGFYDERGRSLRRAFLRAPLQFRRVSSRFGARYHPILHMWRAHEGVDFSAAYGTPARGRRYRIGLRLPSIPRATASASCSSPRRRPCPPHARSPPRAISFPNRGALSRR